MSGKPKQLFWVEMKLSERPNRPRTRRSAGVRGGKRSSLAACQDAKDIILRYDPGAEVKIYRADVAWEEVQ